MDSIGRFTRLDTESCRPKERFDFWRSLHPLIEIEPKESNAKDGFAAKRLLCQGGRGTAFGLTTAGDTISRFGRPTGDFLLLSSTISGAAEIDTAQGTARSVAAGPELVVIDSSRPMTTRTSDHSHMYLTLPFDLVRAEGKGRSWPPAKRITVLPSRGLVSFLLAQMQHMALHGESLDQSQAARALDAMVVLALGALEHADPDREVLPEGSSADALHAAALRYIDLNFVDLNLTASQVAAAVGCSRAQLYRVFEGRGASIGGAIRDVRFECAKRLLRSGERLSVKQVAHRCGYRSVEAFIRAFRARTDQTPSQFRN